ncbi:MAG: DUF3861 domain-containing protein [Myxococcota bacterium]|nr:DUF3861 domain-containing protein [Myxococcota bacterium]
MAHHYEITVQELDGPQGSPTGRSQSFQTHNHDDVLSVMERIQGSELVSEPERLSFALGLKLFGETMLHERGNALFSEMKPAFGAFMRKLKGGVRGGGERGERPERGDRPEGRRGGRGCGPRGEGRGRSGHRHGGRGRI